MARSALILFFLFLLSSEALAYQNILSPPEDTLSVRQWTLEDGLPVNTTGRIFQDSTGYLWISTYDGLVRFDGLNFDVFNYSNTPAMPHNRATLIYQQEEVGLWVGLEYGGVLLIREGQFQHYGEKNGFTSSDLTQLFESPDGGMYFITNSGLYVFKEGTFYKPHLSNNEKQNQISDILFDTDGSLWLATNDGLLHYKSEGDIDEYMVENPSHNNQVLSLFFNQKGNLIAGTPNGIYKLKNGVLSTKPTYRAAKNTKVFEVFINKEDTLLLAAGNVFRYNNDQIYAVKDQSILPEEFYSHAFLDSDNTVWLTGTKGTLSYYRNETIKSFSMEGMEDYHFNNAFEDREGTLWLATNLHGMLAINKSKVRTIGEQEGLSGNNILALHIDRQNRLLVGTRGDGLNVIHNNTIQHFRSQDGLTSEVIHSIAEDSSGNLWLGYLREGIDKVTDQGFKNYKFGANPEINNVRSIYTTSDGKIWAGTYGGLILFDPEVENHRIYTKEDGLAGNKVRYLAEDSNGTLWIGTLDGGVSRFSGGEFKNYTLKEGLSSNNIRSIYIDEFDTGTIWIGTENNGLNRFKDGKIDFVNMDDGLPDHIIHWISQDEHGWLWMSSNRGIFKVNKSELLEYMDGKSTRFTLLRYGTAEGMRNPEANGAFQEAGFRTPNGYFLFATQEGVAIINSTAETINQVPPTVLIKQVHSGDHTYQSLNVEIERGYKTFSVDFHALTFINPEKTRFRYRLNNFTDDWTEIAGIRSATFANVPPGEYTFEVFAANNDGVWSEHPAKATIVVPTVFYEQAWFYLILLLVFSGTIYGVSQLRNKYLLKQQKELEEIIKSQTAQIRKEKNEIQEYSEIINKQAEQLRESNNTKDKFFSLIAHDLRNPFQALIGLTELTLMDVKKKNNPELTDNLEHIYSSAKSLHKFVEELLKWASLQNGKLKPSPELVNLKDLLERITELFAQVADQKQIEFELNCDPNINVFADLNMMETVLRNLVSNALKFTRTGGTVFIEIHDDPDADICIIKVRDTGIGMPKQMVNNLLRIDTNSSRTGTDNEKGTGLGLLICKEMISLHNGNLDVESKVNRGTTFTVKLPKKDLQNVK